jgi:mRNA interferase RelE/StbE
LGWIAKLDPRAFAELQKLDRSAQRRITDYLRERIAGRPNPRETGKALTGEMAGFWRYRVGDYRLICSIDDERHIVWYGESPTVRTFIAESNWQISFRTPVS